MTRQDIKSISTKLFQFLFGLIKMIYITHCVHEDIQHTKTHFEEVDRQRGYALTNSARA